nr:uncharacterized protein LOC129447068 [Misgurnus anguillicaudatus]
MELIPELKTAVVTFNIPRVAGKFLEECKTHRKFKDYGLKSRALERSTCIRVENLPSIANKVLLELYFEKWGGPIEEIITLPMEQAAIITFKNEEDMEKARKMEHTIGDVSVKIHPYYKSLGTALYGSNRPTWKLPEPFKVNIHSAIREFLLKKKLISSIIDKMSSQFCQINIDKPEVLLSPDPALLKQKGLTRKHVDGWRKNASEAFESIISNYKAFELPVSYPLWTKVENEIKEVVKDLVFTHMDSSKGVLTVASLAHDVNDLRPLLEKMLERASAQMEREKNSVTEDMEMTPGMYSLLLQDGLQTATAASPQLRLDYNKKINKLHLSGVQTEILAFKYWVLEKKINMKQTPLKIDRSLKEFLRSVDCDEMSKDLFVSQGISAVYTEENGDLVLIGSTDRALSEAQERLNVVLQTKDVFIEDQGVRALQQWQDLIKQQQGLYSTSKKKTVFINTTKRDKVTVSGFKEPVIEISQTLGDFIKKHTRSETNVKNLEESYAVVLENVADDFTQDVLSLLVENVSGLSEKDFSMELIPELKTAVVIFNIPRVAGKFLEESKTHRKFKDYGLKARALERSTCIRVENLPSDANKLLLELYFQKWGGPVEETITLPMEQAAIMTFKNEEDMEKVRKMEHTIGDVPVKIHLYYKSLGTALYGSNRPTWKLPEPFKVDIHSAIREFLLKKNLISSISDKMSSQFCQINIDKPEVLLSPDPALLKQKGVTRKHVDGWRKNASEAFESIISNYKAFELPVLYPLWTKVENEIKEMVKDLIFTHMDSSKGVLTVAGLAHDVNDLRPLLEKMLERASAQMEREKNSITEDMEMTPGMYSLLLQDGLQTATAASPQLCLDYNKKMNKLQLSGLQTEILVFTNWVLEKQLNMKQAPLKIDHSLLEFLRSVDCDEMSKDLFVSHGISAVYTVENGDLVLIGSTDRALSEAQKRLNMVLESKDVIVEDQGVRALQQWQDLIKQQQSLYSTPKKRTVFINTTQRDRIIVSGFKEPVMEISQTLGDFIKKHTRSEMNLKNLEESYAVVLENVAEDLTKDVLSLLVENVSGLLEKDFSMELIPELKTEVVTFNVPRVAGKFIEECKTHRKFKDYGLKARALERSTCIRVENLPSDANKMLLELYFEKWGGPVEEIITLPMDQAAIITFKNEEDKEKILKTRHIIIDVPVKIYPYYKSLGRALYGSNRPTWKLPEPFKVNIHPAIRRKI